MSSSQLEAAATSQFGDSGVPITILKVFPQKISYTVPSFPVIAVQLKRIKYQVDDGSGAGTFDGFIREDPILKRTYPVTATIEQWPDAFFVQVSEGSSFLDCLFLLFCTAMGCFMMSSMLIVSFFFFFRRKSLIDLLM